MNSSQPTDSKLDFYGMVASTLCAAHCAALPILLMIAPIPVVHTFSHEWVEWAFILAALGIALPAFVKGVQHHRNWSIVRLAIVGFALIACSHLFHDTAWHYITSAAGGIAIAVAHLRNRRQTLSCSHAV